MGLQKEFPLSPHGVGSHAPARQVHFGARLAERPRRRAAHHHVRARASITTNPSTHTPPLTPICMQPLTAASDIIRLHITNPPSAPSSHQTTATTREPAYSRPLQPITGSHPRDHSTSLATFAHRPSDIALSSTTNITATPAPRHYRHEPHQPETRPSTLSPAPANPPNRDPRRRLLSTSNHWHVIQPYH